MFTVLECVCVPDHDRLCQAASLPTATLSLVKHIELAPTDKLHSHLEYMKTLQHLQHITPI